MFKKFAVRIVVISLLVLGAGVVYAQQGGGNGNGGGNNSRGAGNANANGNQAADPANCLSEPQQNAYNNGGIGFVNPQNGQQWNGQQRGNMNRGAGSNGTGLYTTLPPATVDTLPQEVVDLMIAGWLDEQHAYAAYESIMVQFGQTRPFTSVQQAEVQHAAAWEFLFDRYGIAVPDVPAFDIPAFASVQEACALGAEAEIANFALYDEMLEAFKDYPDVYQVALALRNASEFNHLPAFQSCAGS